MLLQMELEISVDRHNFSNFLCYFSLKKYICSSYIIYNIKLFSISLVLYLKGMNANLIELLHLVIFLNFIK